MESKQFGNALFVDEQFNEAVAAYSKSLEENDMDADTFSKRAAVYLKLKKWEEARSDADHAVALDVALSIAYLRKGHCRIENCLIEFFLMCIWIALRALSWSDTKKPKIPSCVGSRHFPVLQTNTNFLF